MSLSHVLDRLTGDTRIALSWAASRLGSCSKAELLCRLGLGWRLGTGRGGAPLTRRGATETAGDLAEAAGWGSGARHSSGLPCARSAPALWDERGWEWRAGARFLLVRADLSSLPEVQHVSHGRTISLPPMK
jgi:hypothetical protein